MDAGSMNLDSFKPWMEGWKDGKVGNLTRLAVVVHRASQPHEKTPRAAGGPLGVGWVAGGVSRSGATC